MTKQAVKSRTIICLLLFVFAGCPVFAFPRSMIIAGLKGPWELSVSSGAGAGLSYPINVENEDHMQTLDQTCPVAGSPIQIKLLRYLPDLKWKTTVIEDPKGGSVVTLAIEGGGAQQQINLLADVPERRSVTSSIGGLAVRHIYRPSLPGTILETLKKEKGLGLLTVWTDPNEPMQVVVKKGDSIKIPGTSYTADILDYMPHYSIDRKTKEVNNYSDDPVNPAINVRLSDGRHHYEQWIWSNFSASPHAMSTFPIRIEFGDFDVGPSEDRTFIVTSDDAGAWLYYKGGKDVRIEKAQMQHPYPFKNGDYTFSLESVLAHGTLSRTWSNKSDQLNHPALVVSVELDGDSQEAVVELDRPAHVKTRDGMLILRYHQKAPPKEQGAM